jgi:putative addiction module component (TIGR02574 family)
MNARTDALLHEALRLSAQERSAVAAALIDSLEDGDEASVRQAWRAELLRRQEALRAGASQPDPWTEARTRIQAW